MNILIFFISGLIVGSFLNVLVYRLSLTETILGRSHCPHCKTKIKWYDNIPLVSFIMLKARCRDCGEQISWQYPLVEFFTGVIFAIIGGLFFDVIFFNSWAITLFYLGVFAILMVVFLYDLRFMEIPMVMVWVGVFWTILFLVIFDIFGLTFIENGSSSSVVSALIGGVVSFSFFFLMAYFSKEKWMGLGDGYVGFLIGLVSGWPQVLVTLMLAFTIGAFISLVLVIFGKKGLKSQVPFAPFLVLGLLGEILFSELFPNFIRYLIGL